MRGSRSFLSCARPSGRRMGRLALAWARADSEADGPPFPRRSRDALRVPGDGVRAALEW